MYYYCTTNVLKDGVKNRNKNKRKEKVSSWKLSFANVTNIACSYNFKDISFLSSFGLCEETLCFYRKLEISLIPIIIIIRGQIENRPLENTPFAGRK